MGALGFVIEKQGILPDIDGVDPCPTAAAITMDGLESRMVPGPAQAAQNQRAAPEKRRIYWIFIQYSLAPMSRYPALFHKELRALWDANPCSEVRRLLWEIARLHNRLIDAYDLIERLREQHIDYQAALCLTNMRVVLEAEPSVKRELAMRRREAARRAAQPRAVISTVMMPPIEGPPWPFPRHIKAKKRSRR